FPRNRFHAVGADARATGHAPLATPSPRRRKSTHTRAPSRNMNSRVRELQGRIVAERPSGLAAQARRGRGAISLLPHLAFVAIDAARAAVFRVTPCKTA